MRKMLAIGAAALLFMACGGGDDDDDDDATPTTTTTAATDDESTTSTTEAETSDDGSDEVTALESYVSDVLLWSDGEIAGTGVQHDFDLTSATYGDASVTMAYNDELELWYVEELWTFGDEALSGSVSLGNGNDSVSFPFDGPDLTPSMGIGYGEGAMTSVLESGGPGDPASWTFELDPAEDTAERYLTILWRNADSVAVEGWATVIPAGPFAAG